MEAKRYTGKAVQIMAMSECPNKCEHCFIHFKGHIGFDDLDKMLSDYTKEYEEVILNGTELIMDERYIDLCVKYGQDFIYTNGMLLTPEKRKMIIDKGIKRISISLHYGIQEQLSKASLEEISEVIKETIADGLSVRVLCVISKDNYKLLPDIADYVYSLGVKSLKFINMLDEGKAETFDDVFLTQEEIYEFFDILEKTRAKYDKTDFYITRNGAFGNDPKRENHFMCPAAKDFILLTPDHCVYPCNGLNYPEYQIGYWDETGIYITREIEHGEKECMVLKRQLNLRDRN